MKITLNTLVLVTCLASSPTVAAQSSEGDSDAWVPVKHLSFTDEDIEGGKLGPDGELIETVRRAGQKSLIELRQGFEAEIIKTMEDM